MQKRKITKKKKKIVTEAPISFTVLSIINQAAAKICNTNNLVQPGIAIKNANKNIYQIVLRISIALKNN